MPLVLQDVSITIAATRRALVSSLSLAVEDGEIVTIMGASGAGKSTLLAFIAGHLDPAFGAEGRIWVGGQEISSLPPEQRRTGIMFQDDLLFPHLSAGDNMAFGLKHSLAGKSQRRRTVEDMLARAGLAGFHDRDPATLSGGQRARISLLRTLLAEPAALLLDEPFSKFDAELRADMRKFVFKHALAQGLPILLVTHDEADAVDAGGRTIRL